MRFLLTIVVLISVAACASGPPSELVWVHQTKGGQEFEGDKSLCMQYAYPNGPDAATQTTRTTPTELRTSCTEWGTQNKQIDCTTTSQENMQAANGRAIGEGIGAALNAASRHSDFKRCMVAKGWQETRQEIR